MSYQSFGLSFLNIKKTRIVRYIVIVSSVFLTIGTFTYYLFISMAYYALLECLTVYSQRRNFVFVLKFHSAFKVLLRFGLIIAVGTFNASAFVRIEVCVVLFFCLRALWWCQFCSGLCDQDFGGFRATFCTHFVSAWVAAVAMQRSLTKPF